ncbi:FAD-binding domain-containing protein [Parathielavia appendiculata]|uniref:FAD-binding domain-containing protein n=1 Tax=Parathielavia appendiculata TaxID=2587402 RepID=A0AAN6TWM4_9PEZI|nr:FAD-binding domain-containing protein [Parathielavia appendiculata]
MTQLTGPVLLALALSGAATSDHDSSKACAAIASALPNLISFPNSSPYSSHNIYWSARQSEARPSCFVAPNTAQDVAKAIKILTRQNIPFAVKAGGHTPFEGASNIAQGVTLDLANLNAISVALDRKTVSVGAGARWINVSEALDPLGLAVVGGRSATVGVSGLILGGGISYFSGSRGWACDNVRNYEVVLASGEIVNASPRVNRNLYWALRGGGGSNFGIVTRFDLASFDQGELWANSRIWPGALNRTLIPLMHDLLVNGLPSDPEAHTYFVMTYYPQLGGYLVMNDQYHATYSNTTSPPDVFAAFHDAALPTLLTNTRLANVSRLLRDIEQPFGMRQAYWDTSLAATATPDLLLDIVPLWEEQVALLTAAAAAVNSTVEPYLVYQGISSNILEAMQVNGGNALGLKPEDGPVMIVQLSLTWSNPALDEVVETSSKELIDKVNALAASRGARSKNGYIYMNYAADTQDVYAGYGRENLARLRHVAKRYDPEGKFRKLWRGYFKL